VPAFLKPLELAATLSRLMETFETDSLAHLGAHVVAICRRGEQDIDREQHCLHAFSRPPS
jgi:hypothetical protein